MNFEEAKEQFVQSWGTLGSSWGVTRTMAQIHALLLIHSNPLSAEEVMEELKISRGNANMNLRVLIDWGLVHKKLKSGERKEYFVAEKDMSEVIKNIIIQRKKRELEPMIKMLEDLSKVEGEGEKVEEFKNVIQDIRLFSHKADSVLDTLVGADSNWFMSTFLKMIK